MDIRAMAQFGTCEENILKLAGVIERNDGTKKILEWIRGRIDYLQETNGDEGALGELYMLEMIIGDMCGEVLICPSDVTDTRTYSLKELLGIKPKEGT